MYAKTSSKYNEFANDVQCDNFYYAFPERRGGQVSIIMHNI